MVAPLNVNRVVCNQKLHYFVGVRSSVVNVAHNMKPVNRKPLYQKAERLHKFIRAFYLNNSVYNFPVVNHLVVVLVSLRVKKLINYKAELGRDSLPHSRTRVL